jgi:hypothetical protein
MNDCALPEELGVIKLASPCNVKWSAMSATEDTAVRFCDQCQLNVYDVSQMSAFSVRELVMKKEGGRTCMRFFRRFDGTLLTKDCPRGLAVLGYLYNREKKIPAGVGPVVFGLMLFFLMATGLITLFGDNIRRLYGMSSGDMMYYSPEQAQTLKEDPRAAVLAKFNAAPPCPTSRAPVR